MGLSNSLYVMVLIALELIFDLVTIEYMKDILMIIHSAYVLYDTYDCLSSLTGYSKR